jgi:hypothetical protein
MTELPTPPLALRAEVFTRHYERLPGGKVAPDNVIQAAADAASSGHEAAVKALATWRAVMSDQTLPEPARLVRAKKTAGSLIESIGRKLDAAIDKVQAELSKIDKEMMPTVPASQAHLTTDGELRALMRTTTYEKRSELFAEACKTGNDSPFRAMLAGHPSLSGLSSDEMKARTIQYQRARHPRSWARKERLGATLRDLKVACDAIVDFAKKLFAGATKYEQAAAAAAAAEKGAAA